MKKKRAGDGPGPRNNKVKRELKIAPLPAEKKKRVIKEPRHKKHEKVIHYGNKKKGKQPVKLTVEHRIRV